MRFKQGYQSRWSAQLVRKRSCCVLRLPIDTDVSINPAFCLQLPGNSSDSLNPLLCLPKQRMERISQKEDGPR